MKETVVSKLEEALRKVGVNITNIYDLVNSSSSYSQAIPVLVDFLLNDTLDDNTTEGIIRALAVKEAKGIAGAALLEVFHKTPKSKELIRWAIGNTINSIITEKEVPEILPIVTNKANGRSRQMFVLALGKIKTNSSESTLINLLLDDEVASHAIEALGKLKSTKAVNHIRPLLNHSSPLIRKEAQKFLKKID